MRSPSSWAGTAPVACSYSGTSERSSNECSITWDGAGPLSLPCRTEPGSTAVACADVWLRQGCVQRRDPLPRRCIPRRGEDLADRGAAARDHRGQDPRGTGLAGRGCQCGVGAVGPRRASGVLELPRLGDRTSPWSQGRPSSVQVPQGQPAVCPVHSQRIHHSAERTAVSGEDRRCENPLVAGTAVGAVIGHGHPGAGRPLLRQLRGRHRAGTVGRAGAGSRCGSRPGPASDRRRYDWPAQARGEPEKSRSKTAQVGPSGTGEGPSRQGKCESGKVASQGRDIVQQGVSHAAGPSPQRSPCPGPREPSGLCRGLEHRGDGPQPVVGAVDPRCWLGPVRTPDRGEGRAIRPHPAPGVPLAAQFEDLLDVCARYGCHAAGDPRLDVSALRRRTRSGSQRRDQHPRRRACGEEKRLWSRCQSPTSGGSR
ncbi:hypothetical protein SAMN05660733_03738 [Lentzea albidocapillata]|uniref:Uncharacterized protein n=1 Tax=Lentzea albidocapillata TaxID=40571 RepID=A0A1W2E8L8_9PSEU|nr:hypothetical protein SAMN05660733_03738 [Lentzea albidocapillata]